MSTVKQQKLTPTTNNLGKANSPNEITFNTSYFKVQEYITLSYKSSKHSSLNRNASLSHLTSSRK